MKNFLTKLNQHPWSDVCLITQGAGITPGLQLIDYFLQVENPPRVSLLWCVKARYPSFENYVDLAGRERASSKFQYLIIPYGEDTTQILANKRASTLVLVDESEALLQLCQSKGICHPETVDAVLLWAGSKGNNKSFEKKVIDETMEDSTLVNLYRISESLRAGLLLTDKMHGRCVRGCDVVSYILSEDYTPSRESALALGREMVKKLKLLKHVTDAQKLLLDDADEYYIFCDDTPQLHRAELPRESNTRFHLNTTQGMLLAVCGYVKFEEDMIDLLQEAGARGDQICQFPEGSTPLSALSKFIPARRRTSSGLFSSSNAKRRPPITSEMKLLSRKVEEKRQIGSVEDNR